MRPLIVGIVLGMLIMGTLTWAGHVPWHADPNSGVERFNRNQERYEQEQFRQDQRQRWQENRPC